ncbi:MAG: DMT family transporter [Candidatus Puniceispirillales bacterium]
MPEKFFPAIFVLLWASAFISAVYGLTGAGPFSYLFVRFAIVTVIFALLALALRAPRLSRRDILVSLTVGVLMHGCYLGGVFFAISLGTSAGVSALISSSHPVLTAMLARPLTGERVTPLQWLGIGLGFTGVLAVVWPRLGGELPPTGLVTCVVAAAAMSIATGVQKRFAAKVDLLAGNAVQALAAAGFFSLLLLTVEPFRFEMTAPVVLSMVWVILFISLGAISILMLLIRKGRMAATSSLFFLVPPVSAVLGHLIFDEQYGVLGMLGFVLASAGVWLVNRKPSG